MRNIALLISFDGAAYCGWQSQKNAPSVQQRLEKAIEKVCGGPSSVTGCSRTDAGVHAKKFVCSFKSGTKIPAEKLPFAINTALPHDIRVKKAVYVPADFNARFSAREKTYAYKIINAPIADPLFIKRAWHYPLPLSIKKMKKAARHIVGKRDFKAFMAAGSAAKTTVRTVKKISIKKTGEQIEIAVTGDGFLYNMVRIIAGTLAYVGAGKLSHRDIPAIIKAGDRRKAGITAPPQGLMLEEILYEKGIDI